MNWAKNKLRADIIVSLSSMPRTAISSSRMQQRRLANAIPGWSTTPIACCSDTSRRMLYVGRLCPGVLVGTPATMNKMTAAIVTPLAKRVARTAHPMIHPIRVNRDEEWFVMFVPSMAYRDLLLDPVIINALQYAWNRGSDNPLFTAGDILYDGVIIREIPDLPVNTGAGAGGIDVAASYLCGAQALGIAWAQRTKAVTNTRDYGFMPGSRGHREIRRLQKLAFGVNPTTR